MSEEISIKQFYRIISIARILYRVSKILRIKRKKAKTIPRSQITINTITEYLNVCQHKVKTSLKQSISLSRQHAPLAQRTLNKADNDTIADVFLNP